MRIFGNPAHPMVIHFPIALWPAHWGLHLAAGHLPEGVAPTAGFWLLAAGTAFGWVAVLMGLADLREVVPASDSPIARTALAHACVNGTVLAGYTVILALEYRHGHQQPSGSLGLTLEGLLLVALFVGNHLGGRLVWSRR